MKAKIKIRKPVAKKPTKVIESKKDVQRRTRVRIDLSRMLDDLIEAETEQERLKPGWLKEILEGATEEVNTRPKWMRQYNNG